jgi:hypothetical protein
MCSSSSHENLDSLGEHVMLHVVCYIKSKVSFFNFSTCQWKTPKVWKSLGTIGEIEFINLKLISTHD